MRFSWRRGLRLLLLIIVAVLVWMRFVPHRHHPAPSGVPDLSTTSPLNQPGSGPAPADAYPVYSALYQTPIGEPIAIAQASRTDIPQVGGSCLRPSTPQEREMADAFVAANRQSHAWQQQFTIPSGYRLLDAQQTAAAQACLQTHGRDSRRCAPFADIRHIRYLGLPGFDHTHTAALVSVIKSCGGFCGSGGIFPVHKTATGWQRSPTTSFTRDCSWIY